MRVSVIISTRNRPELLIERSLPSVYKQTFREFETIIINDASEKEYQPYNYYHAAYPFVKYFRNKERKGLAWNKNFGIEQSLSKYIVFLDDDNEFHPDFLKETVEFLDNHPEYDAVGVRKTVVYPEGKITHYPKLPCSINDGFLIRHGVFKDVRFDSELQANEDADFGIHFFKKFKMGMIDKTLMTVYGSPIFNTTSYSDYTDYHLDGLAKFWLKNHEYKQYIGRMFLISSGHWFKYLYWLETKLKRYYQIWLSQRPH